jgi:hypothetical protein
VTGDTLNGGLSRAAGENVGGYAIGQGTLSAGANYLIDYTSASFAITPATLMVAAAGGQTKVYGTADPASFTYSVSGLVTGDTLNGGLSRAAGENVGGYAIGQGTLSAGANYVIDYTSASFAITPATLLITAAGGQTKVYGGADPVSFTYTYAGLVNGDLASVISGALGRAAGEDVGNYAITQGTLTAGLNYLIGYIGAEFTITPSGAVALPAQLAQIVAEYPDFFIGHDSWTPGDWFAAWQKLCGGSTPAAICAALPYPTSWFPSEHIGVAL